MNSPLLPDQSEPPGRLSRLELAAKPIVDELLGILRENLPETFLLETIQIIAQDPTLTPRTRQAINNQLVERVVELPIEIRKNIRELLGKEILPMMAKEPASLSNGLLGEWMAFRARIILENPEITTAQCNALIEWLTKRSLTSGSLEVLQFTLASYNVNPRKRDPETAEALAAERNELRRNVVERIREQLNQKPAAPQQ